MFRLKLSEGQRAPYYNLSVHDILGQELRDYSWKKDDMLDMSVLSSGVYFISLTHPESGATVTKRAVVQ